MYLYWKRPLDFFLAIVAMMLLSPLMFLIAVLIKFLDPGPIFFKQIRVGYAGHFFEFWKFRSMPIDTVNIPSDQLGSVKIKAIGRFIRRTNIDELPQLFNILKGDMSIVGPRPSLPSQRELISLRYKSGGLSCKPGLTGLAQVNSYSGMTIIQKASFDSQYARSITFYGDLKIIFKTLLYLLKPPPVY
jgi:O-antigen biosynthesis protein WbqP